jgi:hypothetical protein
LAKDEGGAGAAPTAGAAHETEAEPVTP